MGEKIKWLLKELGQSFMLPVSFMAVAGLLLGLGSAFTNPVTMSAYGLTEVLAKGTVLYAFFAVLDAVGKTVFANLPLIFAVGVALGMAREEKGVAGASYMVAHMLDIAVGLTYSGGILDLIIFGVLPGDDKTHWLRIIGAGIVYFCLYYALFRFLIVKYDFKAPGREEDEKETRLYTKADLEARSRAC